MPATTGVKCRLVARSPPRPSGDVSMTNSWTDQQKLHQLQLAHQAGFCTTMFGKLVGKVKLVKGKGAAAGADTGSEAAGGAAVPRRRLDMTFSSLLGELLSYVLGDAACCSALLTAEGDAPGRNCRYSAAPPVTCTCATRAGGSAST